MSTDKGGSKKTDKIGLLHAIYENQPIWVAFERQLTNSPHVRFNF